MTTRPVWQRIAAAALLALPTLPLLATLGLAAWPALDTTAWAALWAQPSLASAWWLTLGSALAATALSLGLSAWILSRAFTHPAFQRLVRALGPMLALPHAAFAIGFAFLIAPSGWLLRLLSPWATGFDQPPPWVTTQDPWAIGLVLVLVAKEVPFLLWTAASQLQRPDVGPRLTRELILARSMGYGPVRAWWRIGWPQLWPRLRWPLLAVWAYSLTVVDLSLIIGPGSPPTLPVLAWGWLNDADPATNAMGAAAAWLLALTLATTAGLAWQLMGLRLGAARRCDGQRGSARSAFGKLAGGHAMLALLVVYGAVALALGVGSIAGVWPFPGLIPERGTLAAWQSVWGSATTVSDTVVLGLAASTAALLWSVAWLELAPATWDQRLRRLVYLPLALPAVLWVVGLHATLLRLDLDGRWTGLWLAHALACLPYTLIALAPAYGSFDPRLEAVAATLGRSRAAFLWQVKWPLLRPALASALAVGFAVSVAQYLPTLYVGAGRFQTVTTEAVTLASGGQRALTAAFAWLQWLLPMLMFGLAAWWGRPRRWPAAAQ